MRVERSLSRVGLDESQRVPLVARVFISAQPVRRRSNDGRASASLTPNLVRPLRKPNVREAAPADALSAVTLAAVSPDKVPFGRPDPWHAPRQIRKHYLHRSSSVPSITQAAYDKQRYLDLERVRDDLDPVARDKRKGTSQRRKIGSALTLKDAPVRVEGKCNVLQVGRVELELV